MFVLILFFSNTYLLREVTSLLSGGCPYAKAELTGLCFPEALSCWQLLPFKPNVVSGATVHSQLIVHQEGHHRSFPK